MRKWFLRYDTKGVGTQRKKKKKINWTPSKLETSKDTLKIEKTTQRMEKIFVNHVSDTGLTFRLHG